MKTALVVDDSRVTRKLIRQMLTRLHFKVAEAEDGRAALTHCGSSLPDLIMLDWNMPCMDGFEFLVALRKLPDGGIPKVVFCTTENQLDRIASAIEAGADEYVMKPFDEDILRSKLEQVGAV